MRLHRFDNQYLRDFRNPIAIRSDVIEAAVEEPPPPPPPPTFSEDELEQNKIAAKKLGYAEGFEAGLQQAATEATAREKDMTNAIERISEQLTQVAGRYQQLVAEQASELSELVLAIAKKVAGAALDAHSVDTIVTLVVQCLPVLIDKPKIVIELHADKIEAVKSRLEPEFSQRGFEGVVQFRIASHLGQHDVRVDWGNGQANRNTEIIWSEIETLLQHVPITADVPEYQPPTTPTTT